MEKNVGIPTTLFGGPPEIGNLVKLANSQIGFMNIFARPLFDAVTDILPAMAFAVNEMKENQKTWKTKIEQERTKKGAQKPSKYLSEGLLSPRSGSPNRSSSQPEFSHPEGLPASLSISRVPTLSTFSQTLGGTRESRRGSAGSIPRLLSVPGSGSPTASPDISRRSSLGLPFDYSSPPDATSFSRRSSGAFPGANIQASNISTRRSSNTMPSQLHLIPGFQSVSQSSPSIPVSENLQPLALESESTLSQSSSIRHHPATDLNLDGQNALKLDGGGDTPPYQDSQHERSGNSPLRSSFSQGNHRTTRQASNSLSGPVSANSSHNRSSSGAQTNITHSTPYSPTGTLATSFLTVDSDERSNDGDNESWSTPTGKTLPDVNVAERPRSRHRPRAVNGNGSGKVVNVKNPTVNGTVTEHSPRERAVTRRSSRFRLDWWRKKGKSMDSSP